MDFAKWKFANAQSQPGMPKHHMLQDFHLCVFDLRVIYLRAEQIDPGHSGLSAGHPHIEYDHPVPKPKTYPNRQFCHR